MVRESVGRIALKDSKNHVNITLGGKIGMSRNELQNYLNNWLKEEQEILNDVQHNVENMKCRQINGTTFRLQQIIRLKK